MDFKDLRYFLAIVEEGSFSHAATRLGVAQPALSTRVQSMETRLQTALLTRNSRGVTPTEAGLLLAQRAEVLLAALAQAETEVASLGRDPAGVVRIGLPGTVSDILAVPLISRCRTLFPRIKIIVAEAMSGFVRDWVLEGRVELAVLYTELKDSRLQSEFLLCEELVAIVPNRASKTNQSPETSLAELIRQPVILPSGSHGLRRTIEAAAKAQGLTFDPVIEVDSFGNIRRLVAGGHGSSVLPVHAVTAGGYSGAFDVLRFRGRRLMRNAYLVTGPSPQRTRAGQAVQRVMKEVISDLIRSGGWAGAEQAVPKITGEHAS